jgi:hypothetical protein
MIYRKNVNHHYEAFGKILYIGRCLPITLETPFVRNAEQTRGQCYEVKIFEAQNLYAKIIINLIFTKIAIFPPKIGHNRQK